MKTPGWPDVPDVVQIDVPPAVLPYVQGSVPLCIRLRTASLLIPSSWAASLSVTLRVLSTVTPYVRSYVRGYHTPRPGLRAS